MERDRDAPREPTGMSAGQRHLNGPADAHAW